MRASVALLSSLTLVSAYELPQKLRDIYNSHKSGQCKNKLSGTFSGGTVYCGDIGKGTVFLKSNNGFDNLDIDCDGANNSAGACANDPSGQGETAFKDTVKTYGIPDLDANKHPYVVFGNEGASPSFNPQSKNIKPLSVFAIVCNNQLHYGIWGDTNGFTSTGETSLALGQLCFPNEGLSGDNGHDPKDVLYIAFPGDQAVPGKNGANWKASNAKAFEDSIKSIGDKLVATL